MILDHISPIIIFTKSRCIISGVLLLMAQTILIMPSYAKSFFDKGEAERALGAIQAYIGHPVRVFSLIIEPHEFTVRAESKGQAKQYEQWILRSTKIGDAIGGPSIQKTDNVIFHRLYDPSSVQLSEVPRYVARTLKESWLSDRGRVRSISIYRNANDIKQERTLEWFVNAESLRSRKFLRQRKGFREDDVDRKSNYTRKESTQIIYSSDGTILYRDLETKRWEDFDLGRAKSFFDKGEAERALTAIQARIGQPVRALSLMIEPREFTLWTESKQPSERHYEQWILRSTETGEAIEGPFLAESDSKVPDRLFHPSSVPLSDTQKYIARVLKGALFSDPGRVKSISIYKSRNDKKQEGQLEWTVKTESQGLRKFYSSEFGINCKTREYAAFEFDGDDNMTFRNVEDTSSYCSFSSKRYVNFDLKRDPPRLQAAIRKLESYLKERIIVAIEISAKEIQIVFESPYRAGDYSFCVWRYLGDPAYKGEIYCHDEWIEHYFNYLSLNYIRHLQYRTIPFLLSEIDWTDVAKCVPKHAPKDIFRRSPSTVIVLRHRNGRPSFEWHGPGSRKNYAPICG